MGFVGILLGMFAMGVMQLILATALPYIITEIGGGNLYSWVFSSYIVASLITIPIFARIADIYGKKKFYIIGMATLAIGTLYGGLAPNMIHLIIARTIQGLGAGIITPVSLAMISDIFPPEKRGRMIGIFGFVQLLSNILSPSLGGFITKQLGWHWIFFIVLILIGFSILLVAIGNKDQRISSLVGVSEIDIEGGLLLGIFSVITVILSNVISKQGKFGIFGILLFLCAAVTATILVLNEMHHKNPILKVEFFKTKIIRRSIISAIIVGAVMYGLVTILPLCGVILSKQGFKINESQILSLFMIGLTIGIIVSSMLISKFNSPDFTRILWGLMSACSFLMLYSISNGNLVIFYILNIFIGIGTGGVMATFLTNSQNAVSCEDRTILSGLIQMARYLGAAIGVTILTSMIPEVTLMSSISQFYKAFGLLMALCLVGLLNEFV